MLFTVTFFLPIVTQQRHCLLNNALAFKKNFKCFELDALRVRLLSHQLKTTL